MRHGFGKFDIGGIIGSRAEGDGIFTGIGQNVKFMRSAAAYCAGISSDCTELQADPGKNSAVRFLHETIGLLQTIHIGMKGISILHDEFPRAHHAKSRTDFITKLSLNLVEIDG
ncbi:MAG: hypothetical protein JNIBNLAF_02155 [Nitrosomonas europaea]|nr:hypothetical protein [Nitrosomonas europaea]